MTDLAERLRSWASLYRNVTAPGGFDLMIEAADKIERWHNDRDDSDAASNDREAEIERLRTALDDECAAHRVCVEMRDNAFALIEVLRRPRPRDDGTAIAVGGEPGASAGKSE